jgi:hypothetical protein
LGQGQPFSRGIGTCGNVAPFRAYLGGATPTPLCKKTQKGLGCWPFGVTALYKLPTDVPNLWLYACIVLLIAILGTSAPIVYAFLRKIKLDAPKSWFESADSFAEQKQRLLDHDSRIIGTLIFWKNQAIAHRRLDNARVLWGLFSGVSLPVLIQFFDKSVLWANIFLTILTFWTGLVVSLAYTFKSEELFRGYRQCESDYYDLTRSLLDNPAKTPSEREVQVTEYLKTVAKIRALARDVETSSPPSAIRV